MPLRRSGKRRLRRLSLSSDDEEGDDTHDAVSPPRRHSMLDSDNDDDDAARGRPSCSKHTKTAARRNHHDDDNDNEGVASLSTLLPTHLTVALSGAEAGDNRHQMEGRIHRIGQRRAAVDYVVVVMRGSMLELLYQRQEATDAVNVSLEQFARRYAPELQALARDAKGGFEL
jgi:hypothetical protein